MRREIIKIVTDAVISLNPLLDKQIPIKQGESCCLYGGSGSLDSLSLVSLIVSIEESIENKFSVSVILANEKALSQRNSPFATIQSLVDYIESLVRQEIQHV